jgi:hypothetical protein
MVIVPLTIFISMIMIYREVSAQEERTNRHRFSFSSRGSSSAHRNKIAARHRARAYSLAWLLSWSPVLVSLSFRKVLGVDDLLPFPLALVSYCLYPSQGLFNFIVYIFPKVTKRLKDYEREGIANPKRFILAFRDSVMSRGQDNLSPRASRTRSRLQNQNRALTSPRQTSLQTSTSNPDNAHCFREEDITSSQVIFDRSPRFGLAQEDVGEERKEKINK